MGVYIKGMRLPENCNKCPCSDDFGCAAKNIFMTSIQMSEKRPEWCPLTEVTEPHGKLIDVNELSDEMRCSDWHVLVFRNGAALDISKFNDIIRNIATVIEAEEE